SICVSGPSANRTRLSSAGRSSPSRARFPAASGPEASVGASPPSFIAHKLPLGLERRADCERLTAAAEGRMPVPPMTKRSLHQIPLLAGPAALAIAACDSKPPEPQPEPLKEKPAAVGADTNPAKTADKPAEPPQPPPKKKVNAKP